MKKKPSKANLFRFVTLRNPQLLSTKERKRGFVFFPTSEKSQSAFLNTIDDEEENDDIIRTAVEQVAIGYAPFTRKSHVKALSEDLYEFSAWLMKNKKTITSDQLAARSETATPLTSADRVKLWDNLIYQTSQRRSDSIREAIIQMLVADNFLLKNDFLTLGADKLINTDEELQRLACAYVVIPRNVSAREPLSATSKKKATSKDYSVLQSQLDAYIAKDKLEVLSKVYEELVDVVKKAAQDTAKDLEQAYTDHNNQVDIAYENATKTVDPDTKEVTYSDLNIPAFSYEPTTFSDYVTTLNTQQISESTRQVVFQKVNAGIEEGVDILNALENDISLLTEMAVNSDQNNTKTVNFRGSLVKSKKQLIPDYSYVLKVFPSMEGQGLDVYANIAFPKEMRDISGVNFFLAAPDVEYLKNTTLEVISETEDGLILRVPKGDIATFGQLISATISIDLPTSEVGEGGEPITNTLSKQFQILINEEDTVEGSLEETTSGTGATTIQRPVGIRQIGVADFRRVEQEVCCYVPGEVSHIENILAREYKERSTRNLISSETTTETTSETETESLTDTTTSERNELSSEISQVLNEDKSKDYGASAGVNGSFGGGIDFFANGYFNGASSSSSSNSNSTSQTYAEEVTTRALERVVQKVSRKRTSRILREFEENNTHGFDNRLGTEHVTGVYRWVDKIYNNKLVNYGKRLMYEFDIPEPSRFFKQAIIEKADGGVAPEGLPEGYILPEMPEPLPENVKDSRYIFPSTYQVLASKYNAEVNAPPALYIKIGKAYSGGEYVDADGSRQFSYNDLEVPEGYKATYANWKFDFRRSNNKNVNAQLQIANKEIRINKIASDNLGNTANPRSGSLSIPDFIDSSIPVSVVGWDMGSFALNVTVSCERTEKAYQQWKVETYNAIMEAYQIRVQEYNDALLESTIPTTPEGEDSRIEFSSALNRTLEKRELKRMAVDMMTRPHGINTAKNDYINGSFTQIDLNSGFENHASYVKFFEQAFDWEIMAYTFYPYYYAHQSDWIDLFKESNGLDPVFQAFLQAGMSRMVVPVRPGFEEAVTYFLATGRVWMGNGLAIDSDDELYLSISEELQSVEGEVEKEWETRVPTALTIVQADSAVLMEGGLPCYCEDEEGDSTILRSETILTGTQNTPETLSESEPPPAEGGGGLTF